MPDQLGVGLIDRALIGLINQFPRFQTYLITIHQRYRRTNRPTDRRTPCDLNTALCTIVHRAGKNFECVFMQVTEGALISVWKCTESVWRPDCPDPLRALTVLFRAVAGFKV